MYFDNFEQFKQEIIDRLTEAGIETRFQVINRSDGTSYNGLSQVSKESVGVSAVFNMDTAFQDYQDKGMFIEDIVDKIKEVFEMKPAGLMFNPEDFKYLEKVRNNIVPRLVPNTEVFSNRLGVVLEKANDLKVIFAVRAFADGQGIGEAVVDEDLMGMWGIGLEELREIAFANLPSEEPGIMMMGPMTILTNKYKIRGAIVCLDKEFMNKYQAENGEVYILPSSRHEVILIPKEDVDDVDVLRMMVASVNAEAVEEQDQLSNNVYIFNGETLEVA